MFNIKQLVNKITDKAIVPPRTGESSASVLDPEEQHSAEGFLCPPCMKAFPSAEALEEHYLKAHPMEEGAPRENVQLLRQEIEILQTSLVEEKSMSEELKKEMLKIQTEITRNETEKANALETWEGNNSLLKSEVTLLRQQLTDELEHTSELRKEKELLKEKLLMLATQNDTLAADNKSLQSQLNHRNTIDDAAVLRQELVSVQRLMDQMTLEKESEVDVLSIKVKELENALDDARKIQEQSQVELEKVALENQQLAKYTDENYQLKRDLADTMAAHMKKDAEIDNLKEEIELAQKKISTLDTQNQQLAQEKQTQNQSTEKLETTESDSERMRSENSTLKTEVEKLQSQNVDLSKNVQNLKLKIEKCETDGQKLVETHTAERKFVEVKFSEYEDKLKDKEEEIKKTKLQHSTILNQKDAEIARLSKEVKVLQGQLDSRLKELEELQVTKVSLEAKITQIEKDKAELQTERDSLVKNLSSLEERTTLLAKQVEENLQTKDELQKRLDESASDNDIKTATIASLKDTLRNLKLSLEEKETILQSTISEASAQLEQRSNDYESQRKSLEIEIAESKARIKNLEDSLDEKVQRISQLQSSLTETEDFASQTTSKVKSLEAKFQELEVLNNEVKYKLKSSDEEKALLAERCLTEQSKADASHQAYEECKRKLEDSVAALQELGRENQSLQIESAKLQGRKWADDSVVNTCTGCVKEFTLTIRKHHCRHCGQIFCNDCSSRTASVPSSKKPVRVCEVCYQELTSK